MGVNKINMKLSIIIPVYNESKTLKEILKRVESVDLRPIEKEIIIVDDFSTDGSKEILKELEKEGRYIILYHKKNIGKGGAIKTALNEVTGDMVVIQDADLEYDPEDYKKLIKPILEGKAKVVYGSRFTGERKNMFYHHWIGNKFLTFVTDILYNTTLSDMETCYKMWKTEIIKSIDIKSNKFNFEPEVTAKVLKKRIRIYEVPISYAGREYEEGKKISWKDGISALWCLIKYRFVD